jgi:tetratricopeptide (TPR) repeat protein
MKSTLFRRLLALLLSALLVAGCATPPVANGNRALFDQGRALVESGQLEQGLERVQAASKAEPENHEYRAYYFRQRDAAVQRYLLAGDTLRASNKFDEAETAYKQALALDPTHSRAVASIDGLQADRRHRALLVEAEELLKGGKTELAQAKVREVLIENASHRDAQALQRKLDEQSIKAQAAMPQLAAALKKPVTLEFRNAPLRSVFEIISKNSGLNFVFDRDVQPDLRTTVFVKDTSIEDVIKFVLVTSQLERKVLNENTILIYPNRADKVRDYRDMVVKTFYLANADAKQTANMIKSVVKTRDMFVDEKLNILVMRDTPEAVRMAEKLVANQDLGESEVMLEVEVLEVSTNLLQELGVQWPTQISAGVMGSVGTPGVLTGTEAKNFNSSLVRLAFGDPLIAINLKKQDGSTNVLANPRIRVKNREKARIHIGDKVPVITKHRARDPQPLGHRHLPGRHAQRRHLAAPEGRRDPGAGRADQRRGPPQRRQGAGALRHAGARQALPEQERHAQQDRDRAAHHPARRAQPGAAGHPPGGILRRHRRDAGRRPDDAAAGAAPAGRARPRGSRAGAGPGTCRSGAGRSGGARRRAVRRRLDAAEHRARRARRSRSSPVGASAGRRHEYALDTHQIVGRGSWVVGRITNHSLWSFAPVGAV